MTTLSQKIISLIENFNLNQRQKSAIFCLAVYAVLKGPKGPNYSEILLRKDLDVLIVNFLEKFPLEKFKTHPETTKVLNDFCEAILQNKSLDNFRHNLYFIFYVCVFDKGYFDSEQKSYSIDLLIFIENKTLNLKEWSKETIERSHKYGCDMQELWEDDEEYYASYKDTKARCTTELVKSAKVLDWTVRSNIEKIIIKKEFIDDYYCVDYTTTKFSIDNKYMREFVDLFPNAELYSK